MRSALVLLVALAGCRNVDRFSTNDGTHFEGSVVAGTFVRSGVAEETKMCVVLDTSHLQDAPGTISTSDGRFHATALRPIPQIWHDPLSTMSFGDGRVRNVMYMAEDVTTIVSMMDNGDLEVRVVRGAPGVDAGAPPLFAVFTLERRDGACPF